jgi:hypothetical protein
MLFGSGQFIVILGSIFALWLIVLSILFYRLFAHYKRLTGGIAKKNLKSVLEELLKEASEGREKTKLLSSQLKKTDETGLFHLQKVGLVRFNPFAETGGDQSFCLSLLDGHDSGLVISSLHSRETTRIYAKPVKEGKKDGYALSEEEERAIKQAKKIK